MTTEEVTTKTILPPARILVTGAAGGIGTHLVRELLSLGYKVRATDRRPWSEAFLEEHEGLEWVRCDLERTRNLYTLAEDCTGIFHAAAQVSLTEEYEEFTGLHLDATRRLYRAATEAGVEHFVHFSCGSIFKAGSGVRLEDSPLEITNGYEQSKRESELIFPRMRNERDPMWTILRPSLIYGPYCRSMSAGIVTLPPILRGFVQYLPSLTGGPRNNWCHAEDAARAACFLLGHPEAEDAIFNVADSVPLGFGEVLTSIGEAYGLQVVPLLPFPSSTLQSLVTPFIDNDFVFDSLRGVLRELWKRIQRNHDLEQRLRPRVDRKALFYVTGDTILDSSKLRDLGWRPKWEDYRQGIVETVRWYQEHGWVPNYNTQTILEMRQELVERGFGYNAIFEGDWQDRRGTEHAMKVDLDVEFSTAVWPLSVIRGNLDGTLWMHGLATHVPIQGTVALHLFPQGRLVYEFGFRGDDGGAIYRFHGTKEIVWRAPLKSFEAIHGSLIDEHGEPIGEADLTFGLAEQLVPVLFSLRFLLRNQKKESATS